MKLLIDDVN